MLHIGVLIFEKLGLSHYKFTNFSFSMTFLKGFELHRGGDWRDFDFQMLYMACIGRYHNIDTGLVRV